MFPEISHLPLGPVECFAASQGAVIAYPIGTFPSRIGASGGLPKGRYLLQASVVFCAKFHLPPNTSASSPLWGAFLYVEIALQVT